MRIILLLVCVILAGCAPANITAVNWDTGISDDTLQTRCVRVDMRDQNAMSQVFAKYDGWKLVYLSEYTTGHKVGTDGSVCFQRSK